ncbi:MAG: YihY/virulence factor BrkB family protein [Nocardioidaceae bacterium]
MAEDEQGIGSKAKSRVDRLREKYPFVDHVVRMQQHYSKIQGNVLAGAVTYFGFLSFFPILALAFAVVGYVSIAYPDARQNLTTAIEQLLPGIISSSGQPGTISLKDIEDAKAFAGVIGFAGVLYSGLGWLSGMRGALRDAFHVPQSQRRSFIVGKGVDLVTMVVIGLVLIVSVGISGVVKGLTDDIVSSMGLDGFGLAQPIVWVVGVLLGIAASTLLLFIIYWVLPDPDIPARALWQGALLGAVAFEVLKQLVVNVLGGVGGSPFAPLAIAITLVVWINYFSRIIMYGAAWAMTSDLAATVTESRRAKSEARVAAAAVSPVNAHIAAMTQEHEPGPHAKGRFDAGSALVGAAAVAVAAAVLGRRDDDR